MMPPQTRHVAPGSPGTVQVTLGDHDAGDAPRGGRRIPAPFPDTWRRWPHAQMDRLCEKPRLLRAGGRDGWPDALDDPATAFLLRALERANLSGLLAGLDAPKGASTDDN